MGLLRRNGNHAGSATSANATARGKPALAPMPGTTDEYQQRIRAQMEAELAQQRANRG